MLFMCDAKFLFFINDQKSQTLPTGGWSSFGGELKTEHFVCADDDIHRAMCNPVDGVLDLLLILQACKARYLYAELFKSRTKCIVMLICKDGRGSQEHHLSIVENGAKRRA